MRKIITAIVSILLLSACSVNVSKDISQNEFSNINEYRKVSTGLDSLTLKPFELFKIMKFETIEKENDTHILLKEVDGNFRMRLRKDELNKFVYKGDFNRESNFKWSGNEATFYLKYYAENFKIRTLKREVLKGEDYKVIYGYRINELQNRSTIGTEPFNSGFYIIDILPMNKKFPRQ